MAKLGSGETVIESYTIKGTENIVRVGECVLIRSTDASKPQNVACVEKFEKDSNNNVTVHVRLYYRPDDAVGGRMKFHGANELFLSDHYDVQSAEVIQGKCVVHPFNSYVALENAGATDFYYRFQYKVASGSFIPDSVAVYCKCEMPYNPDIFMMQCERCHDWYHLECVGLTIDEARALVHFQCSDCTSTSEDELDAEAVRDNGVPPAIEDQVVSIEQDESSEESENTEGVQAGTGEIEPIYVEDVGEHVWDNFTGNRQGPIQVPRIGGPVASQESQNNDAKMTNLVSMKNKRKQPMGPTMMIRSMKNSANYDTEMAEISATKVMNVINNMEYCLKSGSTLWCKALYLLEDATRRELFLEMKDDASRMAWINFRSEIMDEEE